MCNYTLEDIRLKLHAALKEKFSDAEIRSLFFLIIQKEFGISKEKAILSKDVYATIDWMHQTDLIIKRLLQDQPIQYIVGSTEFYGLNFEVNPNVLIPRPETEELVDIIIKNSLNQSLKILDVGTGSGCIAVSLAKNLPQAQVYALDISTEALKVAKHNALQNNVKITFWENDLLQLQPLSETFDVIVSNPPYVRNMEKSQMQPNVLLYEPHIALFVSDENPLVFYKKIITLAQNSLHNNGKIYLEINEFLGNEMHNLIRNSGFQKVQLVKDFLNKDRFIISELAN